MWKACPKCHALCPADLPFCPNCAPRSFDWQRWVRGAAGAAGLAILSSPACVVVPLAPAADAGVADAGVGATDAGNTDAGEPDSGPADAGSPDAGHLDGGMRDGGTLVCTCPTLAAYGNFGPCDGLPVPADGGCIGGATPQCQICP